LAAQRAEVGFETGVGGRAPHALDVLVERERPAAVQADHLEDPVAPHQPLVGHRNRRLLDREDRAVQRGEHPSSLAAGKRTGVTPEGATPVSGPPWPRSSWKWCASGRGSTLTAQGSPAQYPGLGSCRARRAEGLTSKRLRHGDRKAATTAAFCMPPPGIEPGTFGLR